MPMAKFVINRTEQGNYRFSLKATNGQTIAVGVSCFTSGICREHVETVKKIAAAAPVEDQTAHGSPAARFPKYEIYSAGAGNYNFCLKDSGGEVVAVSEGYQAKSSCTNGIASTRRNAPQAEVLDASKS